MTIDGKTRVCGLMGDPVEHTLSPIIHNTIAEHMGHNLVYVPFHVKKGQVGDAVKGAYELNVLGMNATVPHKSDVIPFLKEIDPLAENIGAVNTLVRIDGGYKGYNTDMTGLGRAMEKEGVNIAGKDVILLGAGGAARAVAFLMADRKADTIFILNRTYEKAKEVADEVALKTGARIIPMPMSDYEKLPLKKFVCVQSTSVGLHPNDEDVILDDPAFYQQLEVGIDLIYKPAETKFLQLCRKNGANGFNGLKMLLYQGVVAYELWNDVSVGDELCKAVERKLIEAQ
ncbi:MAG: shikimate dehydrogenase [Lachnospiraceae bacterium]|nr:shikimate dehydrogenase [Lachnospiraceae bacterium]